MIALVLISLLIFVSISLGVSAGYPVVYGWFESRAKKDMARFEAWSNELFLFWPPEKVRQYAYAANLAIVFVGLVVSCRIVFALAASAAVYFVPNIVYKRYKHKRLERLEEQLPDALSIMVSS